MELPIKSPLRHESSNPGEAADEALGRRILQDFLTALAPQQRHNINLRRCQEALQDVGVGLLMECRAASPLIAMLILFSAACSYSIPRLGSFQPVLYSEAMVPSFLTFCALAGPASGSTRYGSARGQIEIWSRNGWESTLFVQMWS